ncbi:hypothetical protein FRC01_006374 [Tulasnella sp. 417]|nr:hypothetical protein FRC01_006374 [Tulasnella sp. 417]
MNDITPTNWLNEIHQSLLADLQEGSEHDPHFGVTSVTSNPSVAPLRIVQDLDQCIKIAEQSLEKAYLRLLSPLTTAKRRRNTTFSPNFKLPAEILGTILEMTCDIEPVQNAGQRPNHVEHLHNLAAVSWQLFSVVMGTPTLWAVADWRCSLSQVELCLRRSREASIAVRYDWRSEYKSINKRFSVRWPVSFISKHVARWRDAELLFKFLGPRLEMLPTVAAPQLQRIVVKTKYFSIGEPIHLFGGNAPKLRIIDLTGIHLHWEWDPGMIANLRSLVLRDITISEATAGSFLSTIQLYAMLEELDICNVRFRGNVDLKPVRASWLGNLKEMAITGVPCDVSRYFMETIRAPHVRLVMVQFSVQGGIEDWGQCIIRCLDNSILHHVEQALQIRLYLDNKVVEIGLYKDSGPPVILCLDGVYLNPDAIGWLLDNIVAHQKQPTFTVRLSSFKLADQENMRKILPHFLRLRDVTILELDRLPLLQPSLLSRPVSWAGEKQWLWPRLNKVSVCGSGWESAEQDVLAIVKGRLEGPSVIGDLEDAAPDEHERRSRPARIQTLNMPEIGYFSKAVMEQLEDLVPDCKLPPKPFPPSHVP